MKLTKTIIIALVASIGLSGAAQAFTIEFDWEGLQLCNTGRPNIVPNPEFVVNGLPEGTSTVIFRLVDKDAPFFNHGGGTVSMLADGIVPQGEFTYKSPCPPSGRHTYEWTATAKTGRGLFAERLGVTRASREYPE
jgi:phosphatidylethanolamine-binding protein (PEBP) family uncharacterized protein